MKKILNKIYFLRRIYNGYIATKYYNKKYFQILKWIFFSKEDTKEIILEEAPSVQSEPGSAMQEGEVLEF